MRKIVITPILILLAVILFISGLTAVNGLFINSGGGNSLGGGLALIFTLIGLGILAAEQAIVNSIKEKIKAVWIVELLLITALIIVLLVSNFELSVG
jgi:hypothetical protein